MAPVLKSIVKHDFQQEQSAQAIQGRILILLTWAALLLLLPNQAKAHPQAPIFSARVIAEYPHDPTAYTQGLAFYNDMLLESTGRYGCSTVRIVSPETGESLATQPLPRNRFGEGLAVVQGQIHVLTWQSGQGYRFSLVTEQSPEHKEKQKPSLHRLGSFFLHPDKGRARAWGLTTDGTNLIMSDGSSTVRWHEPETFCPIREIAVYDGTTPVRNINELEWINGRIWANIWKAATIAVINPHSGMVEAWVDVSPLLARLRHEAGVANGIAFHAKSKRLVVTGKLWEKLFVIEVPGLFPLAPKQIGTKGNHGQAENLSHAHPIQSHKP